MDPLPSASSAVESEVYTGKRVIPSHMMWQSCGEDPKATLMSIRCRARDTRTIGAPLETETDHSHCCLPGLYTDSLFVKAVCIPGVVVSNSILGCERMLVVGVKYMIVSTTRQWREEVMTPAPFLPSPFYTVQTKTYIKSPHLSSHPFVIPRLIVCMPSQSQVKPVLRKHATYATPFLSLHRVFIPPLQ